MPSTARVMPRRQAGFTLIELLITIALGVVMMVVAVPSFVQFQRNAQLSDAVSNFISAANTARANAMKQGLNTYLVPNNAGTGWRSGWMVYTDANWNQAYNADTDEVVLRHETLSTDISVNTPTASSLTDGYLLFNGSGYPRLKNGGFGGGTIVMSNTLRSSSIIIDPAGRVRSCKTGSTGC
ncbi:GspH/FimT family pseudopilin [Polaromonas jejuensis]|uniref:Type II secretion system protein H n=1 Tax=Polaromonas jejuensis TaxID=457502 RepID=A0ABW0QGQ4_9BURK|nr:GspH/FimT family pseudopilin [Polaromonas jejuensis]